VTIAVLFRRNGPVRNWVTNRRDAHATRAALDSIWPELTGGNLRLGNPKPAVQLVEFSDYECPFCARTHKVLEEYLATNPDVGIVYMNFPLQETHPRAEGAAMAAICAAEEGRFLQMHATLFETEAWRTNGDWLSLAREAGVANLTRFAACLEDPSTRTRLQREIEQGRRLGVTGTPTFIHRRGKFQGAPERPALEELVRVARQSSRP
jgi:protein-disulfide isomerase